MYIVIVTLAIYYNIELGILNISIKREFNILVRKL
jgi:hypothetical protein